MYTKRYKTHRSTAYTSDPKSLDAMNGSVGLLN